MSLGFSTGLFRLGRVSLADLARGFASSLLMVVLLAFLPDLPPSLVILLMVVLVARNWSGPVPDLNRRIRLVVMKRVNVIIDHKTNLECFLTFIFLTLGLCLVLSFFVDIYPLLQVAN